jgi:hypothetical protein
MHELARPGKSDHPDDSGRIFRLIIFADCAPPLVPGVLYAISRCHPLEASRSHMGTADGNDTDWVYRIFAAAGG